MTDRSASSISDWELWACAQEVLTQHGADAHAFVERRLSELAEAGDEAGVWTWFAIDERLKKLVDEEGRGRTLH